jgi:hypothetical membrane protein
MNHGPESGTRRLLACGIWAPVVALSAFAAASARRPGYDQVADTISKLSAQGVTQRWLWTGGLIAYAVLMALCAVGLRRRFGSITPGRIVWIAVLVHAVLMVGVAVFRDDLRPGGFFTLEGALHDVLSGLAFSALVAVMLGAIALATPERALWPLRPITLVVATAMTTVGVIFLFTPPAVQGIPQRVFVGLAAVWIMFFAARTRLGPGRKTPAATRANRGPPSSAEGGPHRSEPPSVACRPRVADRERR